MEFKQVVGNRRSIRYFRPWRPVEREKIQIMLEAANRASRAVNADFVKAIVVYRDELDEETIDQLRTPTTTADLDLAPVYIFWYLNMNFTDGGPERLKQLVDLGALNPSHGWSHAYVDEVIWPQVLEPISKNDLVKAGLGGCEAGLAIAQAMLAGVDEGLGVCLHAFNTEPAQQALGVPEGYFPLWVLLVGYPAEEPQAGGQRPRWPLSDNYYVGRWGNPFEEDKEVTERLKQEGMIQEPAPLPWRKEELRTLSRAFGLPE